jgi:uncharacterized membrane protein
MAKENDLKEELLKQMDKDSDETADVSANSARKIIEKHKTRLRKRKWIAAIGWVITILYALAMHNLKEILLKNNIGGVLTRNEFRLIRWSDTCLMLLIIIAVLLTYLIYSTSRTVTMLQISARLANIEEQLKKMAQDN